MRRALCQQKEHGRPWLRLITFLPEVTGNVGILIMNRIISGLLLVLFFILLVKQLPYFLCVTNGPDMPESARFSAGLREVLYFLVVQTSFHEQVAQCIAPLALCE